MKWWKAHKSKDEEDSDKIPLENEGEKTEEDKKPTKKRKIAKSSDGSDADGEKKHGEDEGKKKKGQRYVLFIGNLPFDTTEEDIKKHFIRAGEVSAIRLLTNKETGKPRGCGYIEFPDMRGHKSALRFHHSKLNGREINVEFTSAGRKTEKRIKRLDEKNSALAKFKLARDAGPKPLDSGSSANGDGSFRGRGRGRGKGNFNRK